MVYKLMVSLKLQNATINYELFHSHNYVPAWIIVSIVGKQLFPRLPAPGSRLLDQFWYLTMANQKFVYADANADGNGGTCIREFS